MAHTAHFHPALDLVVVTFDGEITPAEEMDAFFAVAGDPRMFPDARVIVDKRRAKMTVGPEHVSPQLGAVADAGPKLGKMRIAHVVTRDYDYGMIRVIQARSEPKLPHDLRAFRSLPEALTWLGLDPSLTIPLETDDG